MSESPDPTRTDPARSDATRPSSGRDERRDGDDEVVFRDAETWLAERGVPREPLRVTAEPPTDASASPAPPAPAGGSDPPAEPPLAPPAAPGSAPGPEPTARDAVRVAGQAVADAELTAADAAATPDPGARRLEDDVAEALAFVVRSTAGAPQSEGRLRNKLGERGWPEVVIDGALTRARGQGLVDDEAMVAALVDERRRKGHAPARIRRDLRARGFEEADLDAALASAEAEDSEAAAFALAADKAAKSTTVSAETAFRRVAAHVVRRGYPDGLARKVARAAVFDQREQERTAGH